LEPREDDDWWQTFNDFKDAQDANRRMRPEWFAARITEDWWKTAALDS
jgi:hypothetical protein